MTNTMYLHSTSRSSEHENEYEEGGWQSIRSRCCQQVISIMMNGRGASLSHDIGEVIRDKLHSRELKKHNVNHNYGNLHQYSMQHCTSSNPLMLNVASANRPNHVTRPAVKQLPHSPSRGNSLKIAQSPHHTCSAEWRRIQMGDIRIYNHSACVGYTPTCTGEKVEHTLDRSQVNHRTKRTARQPRRYLYTFGAVGGHRQAAFYTQKLRSVWTQLLIEACGDLNHWPALKVYMWHYLSQPELCTVIKFQHWSILIQKVHISFISDFGYNIFFHGYQRHSERTNAVNCKRNPQIWCILKNINVTLKT